MFRNYGELELEVKQFNQGNGIRVTNEHDEFMFLKAHKYIYIFQSAARPLLIEFIMSHARAEETLLPHVLS